MNKIQEFMLKSRSYAGTAHEIKNLEEKINKLKERLKGPATFSVRFDGWSSGRTLQVYQDKILLEVAPHRDGCDTCKKRLREIYSITDGSMCFIVVLGQSRWDSWVEIPITSDCDPLELLSKALLGRKISDIS